MSMTDRARSYLDGATPKRQREIVTPEGVPLHVVLASIGERSAAYLIDMCIWLGVILGAYLIVVLAGVAGGLVQSALGAAIFLAGNAYFLYFELAWQGATPGKRLTGLRVIDRRGGPLTPPAVIARNLIRDFEVYYPMLFAIAGSGWVQLMAIAWLTGAILLPFLNRDRMRAGDFIGGTWVVLLPRRKLGEDITGPDFHFTFTDRQLSAYGELELQVLEELLRRTDRRDAGVMLHEVGEKIRRKIGWTTPVTTAQELLFLKDFYTAERAYLERGKLFGKQKLDQHDNGKGNSATGGSGNKSR